MKANWSGVLVKKIIVEIEERWKKKKSEEFCRNLNLGLFSRKALATLQSTLKVPGESLSEGELI